MARLKLINPNGESPPDQFRYKHRQDGWLDKCFDYGGWKARIAEHCHINDYPKVDMADAEDQLCRLLPPGWCVQETGEPPPWFLNTRFGVKDVLNGTKVLAAFLLEGAPLVERSVAAERGAICATCPFAINASGCGSCEGLSNAIAEVAGKEELPSDAQLANRACAICKCGARAQIWLPASVLSKGVTEEMMDQFPEWCWKSACVSEYRNQS